MATQWGERQLRPIILTGVLGEEVVVYVKPGTTMQEQACSPFFGIIDDLTDREYALDLTEIRTTTICSEAGSEVCNYVTVRGSPIHIMKALQRGEERVNPSVEDLNDFERAKAEACLRLEHIIKKHSPSNKRKPSAADARDLEVLRGCIDFIKHAEWNTRIYSYVAEVKAHTQNKSIRRQASVSNRSPFARIGAFFR